MLIRRLLLVFALVLAAACGDSDGSGDSADGASANDDTSGDVEQDPGGDADADADGDDGGGGSAEGVDGGPDDFTAGDRTFRLVNLSDQAFDVYGFTTGIVEEYELLLGVEPGTVTEPLVPPEEGKLVVFEPGADDVSGFDNPDNLMEFSENAFPGRGTRHTVVFSTSAETGELESFELWEDHDGSDPSANALAAAADDGAGTVLLMSVPRDGDSFKPSAPDGSECLAPRDEGQANVFAGGTQILAFDVEPPTLEFDLHSFDDGDLQCEDDPVLADASIDVAAGERVLAIIHPGRGSLELLSLPLG